MSLKLNGKNKKSGGLAEGSRHATDYPSREELITQLAQLRSSLHGAYETLDSISPSTDPEIAHKVADMVDIINGLHECEFELMDLLAKDSHFASPAPSRVGDNPMDKGDDKAQAGDNPTSSNAAGDNDAHSHGASQEDLSLYGAYAVSSSRPLRNSNELTKLDKSSDHVDSTDAYAHIPPHHRLDYIKRLEEIQKVNERLVDRCRRLGLVLSRNLAMDKNISTKMKEVKDIVATKEQAQKKILELKALMQQVTEDKLDTEISLSKIENDESYGKPFRFEATRMESRGASSLSPPDAPIPRSGNSDSISGIKKPQSFLGTVDAAEPRVGPDYTPYLRSLRQPFNREHGERESAFVPIHNVAQQLDGNREKNKSLSNIDTNHGDNEVKVPRAAPNTSLFRRAVDGGNHNQYSPAVSHLDHHRHGRSNSARATIVPPPPAGCNTMPSNLFRSNYSKSPPSMQSSSGIGSMNSRSMASLDNGRTELPMYFTSNMSRVASRGHHEGEDNLAQRSFPSDRNVSSNNLNKSYRQPTRSSSFYSELDFRNQEVFPTISWEEDALHTHASPIRSRSPDFRRILSTIESQQITDELNRVLRCRNSDDALPLSQQNWWSSSTELGQADRHPFLSDHQNFLQRGKSLLTERTSADCYQQIMQLHVGVQEITQQIRNLNAAVSANKTATRDALLQHRFDLHNVTRCIRDVSDMVSESMKRVEGQISNQTRLIMDIETRLRRLEDTQRPGNLKYESSTSREREWQVPGRPDFMVSQDIPYQYSHSSRDAISRERDNGQSASMLNNQIPPGTRANNYWDNFRSYSRQNMLSKSNANVPQQFSHEASPSAGESSRHTVSDTLNNTQATNATSEQPPGESRNRNGNGKNLWATSGWYENMSTKKRNKDQKSQSSTMASLSKSSGNENISHANSITAEPLRSLRDSRPEPEEDFSIHTNRYTVGPLSELSSLATPPLRRERERDSGPFSHIVDFEVPGSWNQPSPVLPSRKSKESEGLSRDPYIHNGPSTSSASNNATSDTLPQAAEARHDENKPNSQQSAAKFSLEKHLHEYPFKGPNGRYDFSNIQFDSDRSTNQEFLDASADMADQEDWPMNFMEMHGSASHELPISMVPLIIDLDPLPDNNENNASDEIVGEISREPQRTSSPINVLSRPSTTVSMNIQCEENATTWEETGGMNGSRSSESTSNNNV